MNESDYPSYELHLHQHVGIMTQAGLLLDHLEDDKDIAASVRAAAFIASLYKRHFDHGDREFIAWFDQR